MVQAVVVGPQDQDYGWPDIKEVHKGSRKRPSHTYVTSDVRINGTKVGRTDTESVVPPGYQPSLCFHDPGTLERVPVLSVVAFADPASVVPLYEECAQRRGGGLDILTSDYQCGSNHGWRRNVWRLLCFYIS